VTGSEKPCVITGPIFIETAVGFDLPLFGDFLAIATLHRKIHAQ